MNIVIWTDASITIGTGHLMRCLALADELKRKAANISFVCREKKGHLIELIEEKGYRIHRLPADIDLEVDRELTQRILEKQLAPPEWLIIDHYGFDIRWESHLRPFVKKVMVIDDLANRRHDCDLLLDQNYSLNENRYRGLLPDHCIQLLGPKYALLRHEFCEARENLRDHNGEVKHILVFMGGADPNNETCKVLQSMQMLNRPDIATEVVIGPLNPYSDEVETLASQIPNTTCHHSVENMAKLMTAADLSIGGGGATTWERCCVGLPSIVITIADNQIDLTESLAKRGIVVNLGWFEDVKKHDIKSALEDLLNKPDIIRDMSIKSIQIVDTLGIKRVVKELVKD